MRKLFCDYPKCSKRVNEYTDLHLKSKKGSTPLAGLELDLCPAHADALATWFGLEPKTPDTDPAAA